MLLVCAGGYVALAMYGELVWRLRPSAEMVVDASSRAPWNAMRKRRSASTSSARSITETRATTPADLERAARRGWGFARGRAASPVDPCSECAGQSAHARFHAGHSTLDVEERLLEPREALG